MRRRKISNGVQQVKQKLKNLEDTPLSSLGKLLSNFLTTVLSGSSDEDIKKVVDSVDAILDRLPNVFDRRFFFDGYMVQSIADAWSQGSLRISNLIIPTYGRNWGHEAPIFIPIADKPESYHRMDLIHIPCEQREEIPSLLDYPWLIHEMGHYLLSKHGGELINLFTPEYEKMLSSLRIRSIADRGIAKTRANEIITEFADRWLPSHISKSWVQEIAIDTISIWSCGPAYLSAYQYEHLETPDPFLIEQAHPPVELRTDALIHAAKKLQWSSYINPLEKMQKRWQSKLPSEIRNRYIALKHIKIYRSLIDATIDYCNQVGLPRFQQTDISRLQQLAIDNENRIEGIDVIVGAWKMNLNQPNNIYDEWEEMVYSTLSEYATQ